jgi:ElaB/YqjD/DUF883 family membrane-anchored ribosome-binding protein
MANRQNEFNELLDKVEALFDEVVTKAKKKGVAKLVWKELRERLVEVTDEAFHTYSE